MEKIYHVQNDDYLDSKTREPIPRIDYFEKGKFGRETLLIRKDAEDATLDELTQLCDQQAENSNDHAFCGTHEALGKILKKEVGDKLSTQIMLQIALKGGLQRL